MKSMRSLLPVAAVFVSACVPISAKIPLLGSGSAVTALVGEWRGDYSSGAVGGRRGTIEFTLRSAGDTARGAVFIEHEAPGGTTGNPDWRMPAHAEAPVNTPLFIRFVAVEGNQVIGVLDTYRDPDCGCQLITTFRGFLSGDVIEGTFESAGEGAHHLPQSGRWRVERLRR